MGFLFVSHCTSRGYPFQSSEIITEVAQWPSQSDSRAHAFGNNALLWISSSSAKTRFLFFGLLWNYLSLSSPSLSLKATWIWPFVCSARAFFLVFLSFLAPAPSSEPDLVYLHPSESTCWLWTLPEKKAGRSKTSLEKRVRLSLQTKARK